MRTSHSPERIVSLQPSITFVLDCLGSLDLLIGCTKYCAAVCPRVDGNSRIVVHDSWSAQAAEILDAKPDLVIASVPYQAESLAQILKAGVPCLLLSPRTLADIYRDIALIAGTIGHPERASAVIDEMQRALESVRHTASAARSRPRVFCEQWGKPILRSQPWVAELVKAAGGEFIGAPGEQTTAEEVQNSSPEVLIASWCGAGDRVPLEKIVEQRHWSELPAVQSGRLYCIADELLNTPAPTLTGGLKALAWAIHPELFERPSGVKTLAEQQAAISR